MKIDFGRKPSEVIKEIAKEKAISVYGLKGKEKAYMGLFCKYAIIKYLDWLVEEWRK